MATRIRVGACAGVSLLALASAAAAQDHSHHGQHAAAPAEAPHASHAMTSPYGPWPMNRDASGTSWQPDSGEHAGIHTVRGDWTVMTHALLNLTYDTQSGPRGGDKRSEEHTSELQSH